MILFLRFRICSFSFLRRWDISCTVFRSCSVTAQGRLRVINFITTFEGARKCFSVLILLLGIACLAMEKALVSSFFRVRLECPVWTNVTTAELFFISRRLTFVAIHLSFIKTFFKKCLVMSFVNLTKGRRREFLLLS